MYTFLPLIFYGMSTVRHPQKKTMFWMVVFSILCLSYQKHKEFRFLLPFVAPAMIYAGRGLQIISKGDKQHRRRGSKSFVNRVVVALVVTNCIIGFYFSRVHKRGVYDMIYWLRKEVIQKRVTDVLFLMPCHSTPYYSHIHYNIPMKYITCEPPLGYLRLI
jgi:GPI mannosyltransferase 3